MKKRLTKLLILLLTQTPVYVAAGGEDEVDPKLEPEYLSQSQVTREDYNTMSEFGFSYDDCLADTSRAEVANYNDPRHIVDIAMKKCAVKLEELNDWLIEKRFPPNFRKGHIRKLSSKSVRKVMPQIMYLISSKQQ